MNDLVLRPDSPDGDLIDNLVADIIDGANKHVGIAREQVERLTSYQALADRYGDFNLGIDFGGSGGRHLRADIHKALREKGMSLRAIAATTGTPKSTVHDDVSETGRSTSTAASETGQPDPAERQRRAQAMEEAVFTPDEMARRRLEGVVSLQLMPAVQAIAADAEYLTPQERSIIEGAIRTLAKATDEQKGLRVLNGNG